MSVIGEGGMHNKYVQIGEVPQDKQSKKAFIFDLSRLTPIIPSEYFITTGEALDKMDYMMDQIRGLLKECNKIKRQLIKVKGDSEWLETCWEGSNVLLVKKKESRSKTKDKS